MLFIYTKCGLVDTMIMLNLANCLLHINQKLSYFYFLQKKTHHFRGTFIDGIAGKKWCLVWVNLATILFQFSFIFSNSIIHHRTNHRPVLQSLLSQFQCFFLAN